MLPLRTDSAIDVERFELLLHTLIFKKKTNTADQDDRNYFPLFNMTPLPYRLSHASMQGRTSEPSQFGGRIRSPGVTECPNHPGRNSTYEQ